MTLTFKEYKKDSLLVHGNKTFYQKEMRKLGARWNSRIKNEEPGWVLPSSKLDELLAVIESDNNSRNKYHREGSEPGTPVSVSSSSSVISEKAPLETDTYSATRNSETSSVSEDSTKDWKVNEEEVETDDTPEVLPEPLDIESEIEPEVDLISEKLMEKLNKSAHTLSSLSKRKETKTKKVVSRDDDNPFSYYAKFSENPKKFKRAFDDDDSDYDIVSSSSSASNSPSPYKYMPRPITPVIHKKQYMKELVTEEKTEDISELLRGMKKLQKQMYELQLSQKLK